MVVVKGRMRQAQHICATCWMQDKAKLGHPKARLAVLMLQRDLSKVCSVYIERSRGV